jgi:hypothetical protein
MVIGILVFQIMEYLEVFITIFISLQKGHSAIMFKRMSLYLWMRAKQHLHLFEFAFWTVSILFFIYNFSETRFCLCRQVEPTLLSPIEYVEPEDRQNPFSRMLYLLNKK